ncbi:MAG: hypothetical protein EBU31_01370 [Proteobacteria bacterium]|nr:hypothetical protein [Pseudomonadota bacterium]
MRHCDRPASPIRALALAASVTVATAAADHASAQDPALPPPAADSSDQTRESAPAVDSAPRDTTPAATDAVRPLSLDETPPPQPRSVGGGYVHQFSASTGDGSDMSADRFYGSFSSRMIVNEDVTVALLMGYEFDWYHWSGNPMGVSNPFGDVNLFALQGRVAVKVAPTWVATFGGIFALAGETNADAGDSLYGGGIASIAWTPSPDMILGIGVLGVSQIENDPIIIPVPVVHWHFAEEWEVSTIRRPPASPFVGVDVAWEPKGSKVDMSLGVGWQLRRFRLDSSSTASIDNGVGEDQSWAAFGTIGYDMTPTIRFDVLFGLTFSEQLSLETSTGRQVSSADVDPNALLGIFGSIGF